VSPTIPLGRVNDIPIRVGVSWLLICPAVGVALFAGVDADSGSLPLRLGVAVLGTGLLFASVVLHELGHAVAARHMGLTVRQVVLFLFGGYTEIEFDPDRPGREAAVAIFGPIVSGAAAFVFWGLAIVAPRAAGTSRVLGLLVVVNAAVAAFNLLPGFPLDGGRIARALLVMGGMDDRRAGSATAWIGIAIGVVLTAAGVAGHIAGRPASLASVPVGLMVGVLAWAARPVDRRVAADVMRPVAVSVSESAGVASLGEVDGPVPVVSSGRLIGLVSAGGRGTASEVMDPVLPGDVVDAATSLAVVVDRVRTSGRTLVVTGADGQIVGLILPQDLPADLTAGP
jgi:Zn-dependent protease